MKFGKVAHPETIDFTLPNDHLATKNVFEKYGTTDKKPTIFIGCAKWNPADLKNFYPKGTKDHLAYYAKQFNSIEMNALFYRTSPPSQIEKWRDQAPDGFKFFPKISQDISHFKQLNNVKESVDNYLNSVIHFEDKLGTIFLQMHERFSPKSFDKLKQFIADWPTDVKLSVELRHPEWFADPVISEELYGLLEAHGISNTLVDTAGRRDMLHMRMTTPEPFIRYVGANHSSDYQRLDDWTNRIEVWIEQGMRELHFFIHQNLELASPLLASYFIKQLNERFDLDLTVPNLAHPNNSDQASLF